MNAGKPVLTNIKTGHSIIEKYKCGFELGTDNPEEIAEAILKLYNLPIDDYRAICERAKEGAKDFDFKSLTEKFDEVLNYAILNRRN